MLRIFQSLGALLLGVTFMTLGSGFYATFLALRLSSENFAARDIGGIAAAYYFGFMIGAATLSRLLRRVGYIRSFAILAALACCSVLMQALLPNQWAWIGLRLVGGFAISGLFLVTESWLNKRAVATTRGQVLAIYITIEQLASAGGQYMVGLVPPAGDAAFILTAALLAAALVPVAATNAEVPLPEPRSKLSLWRLFRLSPLGVFGSTTTGLLLSALWGLGPIYAQSLGFSTARVGWYMAAAVVGGLVFPYPIGRLSDRLDRRSVMLGVAAAIVLVAAVAACLPARLMAYQIGLVFLYGGLSTVIYPVTVAHTNDYVGERDRVAAAGGLLLAYGVGATIGPLASGVAMDLLGPRGFFVFAALVALSMVLTVLIRMWARRALPAEAQCEFAIVSTSTQAAAELDPRTHRSAAASGRPALGTMPEQPAA